MLKKTHFVKGTLVLILLFFFSRVYAQTEPTISVHPEVKSSQNTGYTNEVVSLSDGTIHALENSGITYTINIDPGDYTFNELKCTKEHIVDGKTTKNDTTITTYNASNPPTININGSIGEYRLSVEATFTYKKKNTTKSAESNKIYLYKLPEAEKPSWHGKKFVVWNNQTNSLAIEVSGGSTEWSYKWSDNTTEKSWSKTLSNNSDISLTVTNYAPDKKTKWYETEYSCSYKVWPYPSASLSFNNWELYSDEQKEVIVSTKDGQESAWTYEWVWDGIKDEINKTASYTSPKQKQNENKTIKCTVKVSNKPEGMSEEYRYTESLECNYTYWSVPSIDNDTTAVLFSGQKEELKVKTKDGDPKRWSYKWYEDNEEKNNFTSSIEYTAKQVDAKEVVRIKTIATNKLQNSDSERTFEKYFDITIWPEPTIDTTSITFPHSPKEHEKSIDVCELFADDGPIVMSIKQAGGDPDSWTYKWWNESDSKTILSEQDNCSHNIQKENLEQPKTEKYKVSIENKPKGMNKDNCFTKELDFSITIWPEPKVTLEDRSLKAVSADGDEFTVPNMDEYFKGGFTPGWQFNWHDEDGHDLGTSASLTAKNSGAEYITKKYSATIFNYGPDGDCWYDGSNDDPVLLSAKIYPKPDVTPKGFETDTCDYYYGAFHDLEIDNGNYIYGGWTYELKRDEEVVANTKSFHIDLVKSETEDMYNNVYTYDVKCLSNDEPPYAIWDTTYQVSVRAWSKGTVEANMPDGKHVYYNNTIRLQSTVKGGYQGPKEKGGWSFLWLDDISLVNTMNQTFQKTQKTIDINSFVSIG